ncbi:5-formyltetrahydrofolate cyclo-ligase [Clostridium thermarum]|uniref:5-formyltetrahydrofolate cyclo-ligase n=1 Tax=Clostridium thermarum TaxID=1716543 RepID=UPI001121871D|nr:5-formyltetrahydrofolate cyclo-ligase [Clostridium thermarum]
MDKKTIRRNIKEKLSSLSKIEKLEKDKIIFSNLTGHAAYVKCNKLFIFVSFGNEVDTHRIIMDALSKGKTVAVPVILSLEEGMVAVEIHSLEELKENKYGILEPLLIENRIVSPSEIDLAIIPGAAFDKNGGRLGYGAGMYDKYLVNLKSDAKKIALGYDFQVLEKVPMEVHDIRMDEIITD